MSKLIYCGPYYDEKIEMEIIRKSKGHLNNAANRYQSALLKGIIENYEKEEVIIVNTLPIGTWPNYSSSLFLQNNKWMFDSCKAYEIGCINLPIIKQKGREKRLLHLLNSVAEDGDCILLYSCYLPFMNAICKLKKHIHFSVIVTDLPEYYDLGKTSTMKKIIRRFNNKRVYEKLDKVDSFVLLTEQMKEALRIGNRPFTIIEGIWCNIEDDLYVENNNEDKIIIFYAGTLHYQFGIQLLLDAFSKIEGDQYELWICGGGEAADSITELAEKDKRVHYFGFCSIKKVAELRSKASVLVNPRPIEGEYIKYSFPSKTMEYLASGIPVVMFHLPSIPIEYDKYLYYAGEKYGDLFETLMYVINNYLEAKKKAYGAHRFILEKKNSFVQAKKVKELMNNYY